MTSHLFWILLGSSRQTSDSVNKIRHCFRRLCKIVDYLSHPTPRKYKIKRIIMTTLKGSLIHTFQKRFTGLPHFFLGFSAKCEAEKFPVRMRKLSKLYLWIWKNFLSFFPDSLWISMIYALFSSRFTPLMMSLIGFVFKNKISRVKMAHNYPVVWIL